MNKYSIGDKFSDGKGKLISIVEIMEDPYFLYPYTCRECDTGRIFYTSDYELDSFYRITIGEEILKELLDE